MTQNLSSDSASGVDLYLHAGCLKNTPMLMLDTVAEEPGCRFVIILIAGIRHSGAISHVLFRIGSDVDETGCVDFALHRFQE